MSFSAVSRANSPSARLPAASLCPVPEHELPSRGRISSPGTRVIEALRSTGYPELADLDVELREGLVVLRGTIGSYFLKQRAQAAVQHVCGVVAVRNELNVMRTR